MTDQEKQDPSVRLRGGLSLSIPQLNQIQASIDRLTEMIPARYVVVVDTSGQIVSTSGDHDVPDFSILGSLIAADLAASQEIARLTGDYQEYQLILREGVKTHIAICEAGKHLAMLISFSGNTAIGWARKLIQSASKEIGHIPQNGTDDQILEYQEVVTDELPDLYKDALDQIWKE